MTDIQIQKPQHQTEQTFKGLEWLVDEIERNLTSAYNELEVFTKDVNDETRIYFCLGHIHQISGPFKILQCQGLILLCEEMEAVTQAIIDKKVSNIPEACEILVQVIIRLPIYLRQVLATRVDQPESLILLLNDLRATQGRGLVSEGLLFSPSLKILQTRSEAELKIPVDSEAFVERVKRLRQIYQISLIKLIKGEEVQVHQTNIKKIFTRLQEICVGTWRQDLWQISEQVLVLIAGGRIDLTIAPRRLFRALDTELKNTIFDITSNSTSPVDIALIKNLLYYLMLVKAETEEQKHLWEVYKLSVALPAGIIDPDSSRLTPQYDPEVVRSLVAAIQGELTTVRSAVEQFSLQGRLSSEDISDSLPVLSNMADSLALVGQGKLRDAIREIATTLEQSFQSDQPLDDKKIIDSVQGLTEVWAALNAWAAHPENFADEIQIDQNQNSYELETAREALLAEARTDIEHIKESVVDFINSQWDQQIIKLLPTGFYQLSGALKIIGLERAAAIVDGCGIYVQQHLINCGAVIEWQLLDGFADTITTVEYYLEQVASISEQDQDRILESAEDKIDALLERAIEDSNTTNEPHKPAAEKAAGDQKLPEPDHSHNPATAGSLPVENNQPTEAVDQEIIEIFLEEADEVLTNLKSTFPTWENTPEASEPLTVIRRSFHTLKGSGRMVGAMDIGELSWAIENMLNRVLDGRTSASKLIIALVQQCLDYLPVLIKAFAHGEPESNPQIRLQIIHHAEQLARGEALTDLTAPDVEPSEDTIIPEPPESLPAAEDESPPEEQIILEIFVTEAKTHLRNIDHYLIKARNSDEQQQPPTSVLQRSLHTLRGTSDMAGLVTLSELVTPLDDFIKELLNHRIPVDEDIIYLINDGVTFFRDLLAQLEAEMNPSQSLHMPDGTKLFYQRIAELREKFVGALLRANGESEYSADLLAIKDLMAYGLFALQDYGQILQTGLTNHSSLQPGYEKLIADLESIIEIAEIKPILELSNILLAIYQAYNSAALPIDKSVVSQLEKSHEQLLSFFDMLAADQDIPQLPDQDKKTLTDILKNIPQPKNQNTEKPLSEADKKPVIEAIPQDQLREEQPKEGLPKEGQAKEELPKEAPAKDELIAEQAEELQHKNKNAIGAEMSSSAWLEDDLDKEIAGVFVEEAEDIVSHLEETLHAWQKQPQEPEFADRLKRDLHTLKGGARMAGFNALGQYTHEFESVIDKTTKPDKAFFASLAENMELIIGSYDIARAVAAGSSEAEINNQIRELLDKSSEQAEPAKKAEKTKTEHMPQPAQPPVQAADPIEKPAEAEQKSVLENQPGASTQVKEVVRIGSETLDTLVNLSGENIIFRGRVEEQVSEFNHSLDEMDATILRLQEQVRRLGTETEAQIDYRREQIEASGESESFDPLEMDRYSHLQQLSGSLAESASDLSDLKETLADKMVDTESLLIHQSRINVDLQEGLMQTRMVPFSRILPRLRRIVRQVGLELGKEVQLSLDNVQGEMDRTVLDRMVAPLEHMIRNAIDHGIEDKKQRKSAGKPAIGTIAITTYRKGGDIIMHLADDGAGLDISRIKSLAIEKQLMHENALLSDHEIGQFIFHPGFTTLDSVSEISGRGVGMDVVSSEVRQLGGSVDIDSSPGKGTQFTVVLPFTLAVNRALMINVTGDHYALSLNSIDGVYFVSPEKLQAALSSNGTISYGGKEYELQYLGSLLNKEIEPRVDKLADSIGLVLFHSDNRYFAAQVDEIVGTQEIVVKSLGAQFSTVPGLGGATILSDGRVVVIIDLNELARVAIGDGELLSADTETDKQSRLLQQGTATAASEDTEAAHILVVDDSVTVRKVTSRILNRQGYRVSTAKDGVDAMKMLQEETPSVMLLDIEMPRMDGFEVATRVRASASLERIPIIMITSRTGDKHRQRAMELGVDLYMGKPYQEEQLLEAIDALLVSGRG